MGLYFLLFFILVILAILAFVRDVRRFIRRCWILRKLPSTKEFPFLGFGFAFFRQELEDYLEILLGLTKDIYSPTKEYICGIPYVMIANPEDLKTIGSTMDCVNKAEDYKVLRNSNSILTASADIWKFKRRLITPSFNLQVLETFIPMLNDNIKRLISNLHKQVQISDRDFLTYIKYCLLENVAQTSIGYNINEQSGKKFDLVQVLKAAEGIAEITSERMFNIWYRFDVFYEWTKKYQEECKYLDIIKTTVSSIVDQKKQEYFEAPESNGKPQVLINRLIKHLFDGSYTPDDLVSEVTVISFAGYDTCLETLSNIILMLAIHQDVQEKVLEEILSVNSDPDIAMTSEEVGKLSYLDMVIKETLRLFPAVPIMGRIPSKDVRLSNGVIPKGTNLVILAFHMHRNENIWGPKANEFHPEHFLPENVAKRHPFSYLPFGLGIRDCIAKNYGMLSIKLILSAFLKNFKVTIDRVTMKDLKISWKVAIQVKQTQDVRILNRKLFTTEM